MTTEATLFPVGTNSSSHGIAGLRPDSYTAHKLKHSVPEHLHLTTRRFFIGPIPDGWLSSNRKSWYKRRLELSSYSARQASFNAAQGQDYHRRSSSGLPAVSTATLGLSFPQPEDVEDSPSEDGEGEETEEDEGEDDGDVMSRTLEPVSTDVQQGDLEPAEPVKIPPSKVPPEGVASPTETFHTANESTPRQSTSLQPAVSNTYRLSATPSMQAHGLDLPADDTDAHSKRRLLPDSPDIKPNTLQPDSPELKPNSSGEVVKTLSKFEPAPIDGDGDTASPQLKRRGTERVRFRVSEAVADRQERVGGKVDRARDRVGKKIARRQTLREGTIVKMEKMLVRLDLTTQAVPDEFDENGSLRVQTRITEKWREFMVVARKSKKQDEDDFRLQFWKTRVIPEIDDEHSTKKPAHEVKLISKNTHVNLFSSLDKSVVVWHPYKKGTRIVIMKAGSSAHSTEWYTFLKDILGWTRPSTLQVYVPDLDVYLSISKPFKELEIAAESEDEAAVATKTSEAEQAVAGKIIQECIKMLEGKNEWADVTHHWHQTAKPGLAWKRYDRLEWVHGVNEQKMYGSMAMQHSYDLELRPKVHYPTHVFGKKGVEHEEPAAIEGFLIRLTSQKGIHKRMGKAFFKRLYFSTQDNFLVFNKPAQATPPHPPRLKTISGSNVPSAHEIAEKTPMLFEVEPYQLEDGQIKWLHSGMPERIDHHDREAYEEARRNLANLLASDGVINMQRIKKVRKMKWGAQEVDQNLESGSDVDFHDSVTDTDREDGMTGQIDDNRVFELVLDNGLVVRLQAYDLHTRDEWLHRLRKLVKYWKLRKAADLNNFKQVRQVNLRNLKIDEEMEAELGQFGRKWEINPRTEASPHIYHICPISACRTISISGLLYRKPRRHSTFQRCGVILAGGQLLIHQSTLRKRSGKQIPHIHQEKQETIELKDCYIYSGLIVEDDLLYQNRTFDANHMGVMASLPRVWIDDGWTSSDVDVMCCFVLWTNKRKGWFRTGGTEIAETPAMIPSTATESQPAAADQQTSTSTSMFQRSGRTKRKLKRVRQLGVPGRGMVFKCRSRAERDLWVMNIAAEIERIVERQAWEEDEEGGGVRLDS